MAADQPLAHVPNRLAGSRLTDTVTCMVDPVRHTSGVPLRSLEKRKCLPLEMAAMSGSPIIPNGLMLALRLPKRHDRSLNRAHCDGLWSCSSALRAESVS